MTKTMEWNYTSWGLSILAVFGILTGIGTSVSVLSSQMQCSKIAGTTSAMYGAIWAAPPALVYILATFFQVIRSPFVNTLRGSPFGLSEETSQIVGVGYLMALVTWIMTSWTINRTERTVCNPDAQEMTEFKKKLIAELQQKQQDEEKNASISSNGANSSQTSK